MSSFGLDTGVNRGSTDEGKPGLTGEAGMTDNVNLADPLPDNLISFSSPFGLDTGVNRGSPDEGANSIRLDDLPGGPGVLSTSSQTI